MIIYRFFSDDSVMDQTPAFDDFASPYLQEGFGEHKTVGCVVTHGIGGTPANVRLVADELVKRGYTVYAPLLEGHGISIRKLAHTGWKKVLQSERDACKKLKEMGCTKIVPIGLSLGGILSGIMAEEQDCACAVLLSPPVKMKRWVHVGRLLRPFVIGMVDDDEAKEKRKKKYPYAQMYDGSSPNAIQLVYNLMRYFRRNLKKISCPVCVLWAERDDKVAEASKDVLNKKLHHVQYDSIVIKNALHGSTYDPNVMHMVSTMVADYVDSKIK